MTFEHYFLVVFGLVAVYVILGNYLYFAKILPALGDSKGSAPPSFLPSGQLKHVESYLSLLEKKEDRPWYYFYLRHIKPITLVLLLLMVPAFLKVFGLI
jgi:hypothetical protein